MVLESEAINISGLNSKKVAYIFIWSAQQTVVLFAILLKLTRRDLR
jgi:hypothetical protein